MRILLLVLAVPALLFSAGCSDDGGGGDVEAFCELLRESEDDDNTDPTTDEGREAFAELVAVAPDEVKDDLATMMGFIEDLEDMDEDDPDSFAAAMGLMFNPEFLAAGENLETFGVEECGLEPSDDSGDLDFDFDTEDPSSDGN